MYRLFRTHNIRKSIELPDVWDLTALDSRPTVTARIPVPSCIEALPELSSYKGKCRIGASAFFGGDIRLTFKGVSHTADVFLDGQHLGHHYGAYGEFSCIRRDLETDNHVITVIADNSYGEDSALHMENDYYSYGGITRPVVLEQINRAYLNWVHVNPVFQDKLWKAEITACVENITDQELSLTLSVSLSENDNPVTGILPVGSGFAESASPAGNTSSRRSDKNDLPRTLIPIIIPPHTVQEFRTELSCPDAVPYTPQEPSLYYVHAILADRDNEKPFDDLIERFGFREISISGGNILWNGDPLRIKGFNRHEDYAEFGCAVPLSAMARDIALIKSTGANCIRTCHYPNDERFLDLCDENGIYVWEEAHARGLSEEKMRNPHFMEQSRLSIYEMITSHYNHPCIFVWGLLNECASHTQYGRGCYQDLIEEIRLLDGSRPVTFASCHFQDDLCLDLVDIVSYNLYPKWYHNTSSAKFIADQYAWVQTAGGAGKPFLVSEIGAGAIYGFRSDTHCKWSEEYQCDALRDQISAALSFPECSGVILWQYADCRVDESWFSNRPKSQNNKGVVDMYRRKKSAFQTVTDLFHSLS